MTSTEITIPVPPETNLRELASSTLLVFNLLRPWCKAEYSSLALQSIKVHAKLYMQALEFSIVAAQHGFNIADDALNFADLMNSCNEIERQAYLRGMLNMAHLGEKNAKTAQDSFRNVRVRLIQLIRDAKTQQTHETDVDLTTNPKLNELERGISTLEKFYACVSLYISWWNAISMSHTSQSRRLDQVVINYNSLRLKDVVQKWRILRQQYVEYTDKVRQIQDSDPEFASEVERIRIEDGQAMGIGAPTVNGTSQPPTPTISQEERLLDGRQIRKRDRLKAFFGKK